MAERICSAYNEAVGKAPANAGSKSGENGCAAEAKGRDGKGEQIL